MRTSPNGINLIKRFEGLSLEAYQDIAGVWTIGYGHTGADVKPGDRISERQAEALLRDDLRVREMAVDSLTNADLNANEFDALVSFVYNVGVDAYRRSTARRRLNRGDRLGAADALTWFNKATIMGVLREVTGLTRRRAAERGLFLDPVNPFAIADNPRVADNTRITPVEDPPRRGNLGESRTIQGASVAGGAGVAASNMGGNDAEELDKLETNIQDGTGLTADAGETDKGDIAVTPDGRLAMPDPGEEGATTAETRQEFPAKHEKHQIEEQIQFALMVLIILAIVFVIYARIEDWMTYRR